MNKKTIAIICCAFATVIPIRVQADDMGECIGYCVFGGLKTVFGDCSGPSRQQIIPKQQPEGDDSKPEPPETPSTEEASPTEGAPSTEEAAPKKTSTTEEAAPTETSPNTGASHTEFYRYPYYSMPGYRVVAPSAYYVYPAYGYTAPPVYYRYRYRPARKIILPPLSSASRPKSGPPGPDSRK